MTISNLNRYLWNDEDVVILPRRPTQDAAPRTLYVRRDVINKDDLTSWARKYFDTVMADLHVTIAYSRQPMDWMKVNESYNDELTIPAGGPRLMERFGDAIVLLFTASHLSWRHEEIKSAGASWDHPEYQPHITIHYATPGENIDIEAIVPYRGKIVLGPEIFEEVNEDYRTTET